MSGKSVTVVPAYNRDYKSKKAVMEAWKSGLDFLISDISAEQNGKLINQEDAVDGGIVEVRVRYGNLRKVMIFQV